MTDAFVYYQDQTRPVIHLVWKDGNDAVIDFHTGYTFTAEVIDADNVIQATEVNGVTGAATSPNITVTWTDVDLADVDPGTYRLRVTATNASHTSVFDPGNLPQLVILASPTAPAA